MMLDFIKVCKADCLSVITSLIIGHKTFHFAVEWITISSFENKTINFLPASFIPSLFHSSCLPHLSSPFSSPHFSIFHSTFSSYISLPPSSPILLTSHLLSLFTSSLTLSLTLPKSSTFPPFSLLFPVVPSSLFPPSISHSVIHKKTFV